MLHRKSGDKLGQGHAAAVSPGEMTPADAPEIVIERRAGDNMVLNECLSPYRLICALNSPAHNYWSGRFHHLRTDQPSVIGWSMMGQDAGESLADVTKWVNLTPMACEGDDRTWDAYQCWVKNADDIWECVSDPFVSGDARYAGMGAVPLQSAVPPEIAQAYVDPTGRYFQCWRAVGSECVIPINAFRVAHRFQSPTATIAMRVPFYYEYGMQYLNKLARARFPGVQVETLSVTSEMRRLCAVRLDPPGMPEEALPQYPTILLYALEHPTEMDGAWALEGAMTWLVSDDAEARALRQRCRILVIPMLDPDGAAACHYERITEAFAPRPLPPREVAEVANWLAQYALGDHRINVAISVHNVEANEVPGHLMCPYRSDGDTDQLVATQAIFQSITSYEVLDAQQVWYKVTRPARLNGWCHKLFGSTELILEVNGRWPTRPLSLRELRALGKQIARGALLYVTDEAYAAQDALLKQRLQEKRREVEEWQRFERPPEHASQALYQLLVNGIPMTGEAWLAY